MRSSFTPDDTAEELDLIYVRRLQLPNGVSAPDIWKQAKEQPAYVSLELKLCPGFGTAADIDKLDGTTLHYGILCKKIRSACETAAPTALTISSIRGAINDLVKAGSPSLKVSTCIELSLPKASAYDGLITISALSKHSQQEQPSQEDSFTVSYSDMHIMLLLGLNPQERTGSQSVRFSCALTAFNWHAVDSLLVLERDIIELVQHTTFETLEALAITTFDKLEALILHRKLPVRRIRLLFEKPSAVIWADAPAVEIQRTIIAQTEV